MDVKWSAKVGKKSLFHLYNREVAWTSLCIQGIYLLIY